MSNDYCLPVKVAGLEFKNPFYVASGPTTKSVQQLLAIEKAGWAAASIKLTIDPVPYINRVPRYAVLGQYNALTFTAEKRLKMDEGLKLVNDAKKVLTDLILMANITYAGNNGADGWVRMAKKFEEAGADIIELNMCCPNMSYNAQLTKGDQNAVQIKTGASLGQSGDMVGDIVSRIKKSLSIPLFVKLTPEGGQIAHVAAKVFQAGADVVGGTGNRLGMPPINLENPEKANYHLQKEISMSCFSGNWLKPLAQRDTYEIRKVCGKDVVISAAGGIRTACDAIEMSMCGADLIGICTETLMSGYNFIGGVVADTAKWLNEHGHKNLRDVRDAVVPQVRTAQELTIFGGYAHVLNPSLTSPCRVSCPAGVPIQAILKKIAEKKYDEAARILSEVGPLQGLCGYLCDAPCEKACVKGRQTHPLSIKALERFTAAELCKNDWAAASEKKAPNGKRVAVISGGAAGLSCAFELLKAGYEVTEIKRDETTLFDLVSADRLPKYVLDGIRTSLAKLGLQTAENPEVPEKLAASFDAVYVPAQFQLGECGVKEALSAVEYIRKRKPDKRAAIIGDGFLAAEAARLVEADGGKAVVLSRHPSAFTAELSEQGIPVWTGVSDIACENSRIAFRQSSSATQLSVASELVINAVESFAVGPAGGKIFTDSHPVLSPARLIACGKNAAAVIDGYCCGKSAALKPLPPYSAVKARDVLARSRYNPDEKTVSLKKTGCLPLYTDEQASEEASRCLRCGCGEGCDLCHSICCEFAISLDRNGEIVIDPQKCVACGMCFNRCPNKNIEMLSTGKTV